MSHAERWSILGLVLGFCLAGVLPAHAQGTRWPDPGEAEAAPKPAAEVPPQPEPPPDTDPPPERRDVAPAPTPTPAVNAPFLTLPQLEGLQRYLVYAGIFLLSYLVPLLLFPALLSGGRFDPGQATALCLAAGGLLIGAPLLLFLLAREHFANGKPVPWYLQSEQYAWIGAWAAAFLVLAIIAWRTKAETQGDWS